MPTSNYRFLVTLSARDKRHLERMTAQFRLSRSELVRRLLTNSRLPDPAAFAARDSIRDLLRVNADLARLGNLFRWAMDEAFTEPHRRAIARLIADIDVLRQQMRTLAATIDRQVRPGTGR